MNTGVWLSQPKILYSLCFCGIWFIYTKFGINYARTTFNLEIIMEIIMPGHHLRKTNFRYRMAAGLLHRSDLESSSSFCSFFPDFYRSKTQEDSKTRFVQNKNMSLLLNRNLQNSDLLPSVVRRCGGHGGGNCGADSGVRGALCLLPSARYPIWGYSHIKNCGHVRDMVDF